MTIERKVTRYEVADGVALLTLDRPDRLNAWTGRMEQEYRAAFAEAEADSAVRCVVVTGAGRGFCAGADLKALDAMSDAGRYDDGHGAATVLIPTGDGASADFAHAHSFLLGLSKPVIAAVNGPAAGVGFVLACFCDVRFAAAGAKLTTSFSKLGLPAEHGVSWVLPRLIGPARSADMLFSGRVVLAEEAAAWGLVNAVFPADELLERTLDYASTLAATASPASLRVMKRQLWGDLSRDLDAAASDAEDLMRRMVEEPDFKEGVAAFGEGRPPRFTG